jgi:L-serine/L-threonine ammonia-lyase
MPTQLHSPEDPQSKLKSFDIFQLKEAGYQQLVSSSGGNAGVAAAVASRATGVPCTVYVPESAQPACIELMEGNGAQVKVGPLFVWQELQCSF